jgi:formate-dependent nitrite reductase membrane component NrfD
MDPRMSVQVIALLTIASLLILLGYTLGLSNGTAAAKTSFGILTTGKTGAYFIGGGIFVGLLLPTILLAIALIVGPSPVSNTLALISSITILVGNFFSKVSVLKAGVYEPTF